MENINLIFIDLIFIVPSSSWALFYIKKELVVYCINLPKLIYSLSHDSILFASSTVNGLLRIF